MGRLLKIFLVGLVIGIISLGIGAKGCDLGVGLWTTQNEALISGSSQPLPSAVTCLRVRPGIRVAYLDWQDNSNSEESVRVERKILSGEYIEIASVDANVIDYTDMPLSPCTIYNYRIRAYNENGYSMYSNEVSITTLIPRIPAIPFDLSATATDNTQIDLAWKYEFPGWMDFIVQNRVGTTTNWSQIADFGVENDPEIMIEFSDTNIITPTAIYYYRVGAYNENGQSDWSEEASATLPDE